MNECSAVQDAKDQRHDHVQGVITAIRHGRNAAGETDELQNGCTVVICTYKRPESLRRLLDSIAIQSRRPDELIVVDASPDSATEREIETFGNVRDLAGTFRYFHVDESLRGLTRQRNFALDRANYDLLACFDDDIVLDKDCLHEMEQAHRSHNGEVVGIGAHMQNESRELSLTWRLRRFLKMVPTLEPGQYFRSGMATPWRFLEPTDDLVEGSWLTGYAMMWRTELARKVRFNSTFIGYSSGEDLDFSLRMGRHGRLYVAGKARADHLHEKAGRPNAYQLGRMSLRNSYSIHQRCLPDRTWRDNCWFFYAYGMDTIYRGFPLPSPRKYPRRAKFVFGRLRTMIDILFARVELNR